MRFRKTAQIVRPRHGLGTDYGTDLRVLARHGSLELWWSPGHTWYYTHAEPHKYVAGRLMVADMSKPGQTAWIVGDVQKPLKLPLGPKLFEAHCKEIEEWMKAPDLVDHLNSRRTVLVED